MGEEKKRGRAQLSVDPIACPWSWQVREISIPSYLLLR